MKGIGIALAITSLVILSALLAGCSMTEPPTENNAKIKVLVTVLPEAGLVRAVGGDRVDVYVAVPPGADPHTFEPSAQDMVRFSGTNIYFSLGKGLLPFEDNLVSRLSAMNPGMKVVETSPGIVLLAGEDFHNTGPRGEDNATVAEAAGPSHEGPDPHIWVSLKNTPVMVDHIYRALSSVDPVHATYYQANRDAFLANISLRDSEIQMMINKTPQRKFIASHASFGYFARDYGLTEEVIGQPGKEATSMEIETLIRTAREEGISTIVAEPQYSRKAADMIAGSVNGSVVISDALAPDMPQELRKLAIALSGTGLN